MPGSGVAWRRRALFLAEERPIFGSLELDVVDGRSSQVRGRSGVVIVGVSPTSSSSSGMLAVGRVNDQSPGVHIHRGSFRWLRSDLRGRFQSLKVTGGPGRTSTW